MSSSSLDYLAVEPIPMVGRGQVEAEVCDLIEKAADKPLIIFIKGDGGIGKTSLLYAIRKNFADRPGYCVTRQGKEIDCYDLELHSKMRLVQRLSEALPPDKANFGRYRSTANKLNDLEVSGDNKGAAASRAEALEIFVEELRQNATRQRVILLVDTAERLMYFSDPRGMLDDLVANSWQWVSKQLLSIPNVTWIIAGRPQAERLFVDQVSVHTIELEPLGRESCAEFLSAMSERLRRAGRDRDANVLGNLPEDFIDAVYQATDGIPLRLSMLAMLAILKPLGKDQLLLAHSQSKNFDHSILSELMGSSTFGMVLRTLGRLRKGFDKQLLTTVLADDDIREKELEFILTRLTLFGFVKQPRGGRLFLHDVLYTLLDEYVFNKLNDSEEADRVYLQVYKEIEKRELQIKQKLSMLFTPIDDLRTDSFNIELYKELLQQRLNIMIEQLYYQLQVDPQRGFRFYFRYSFEAVANGNPAQDVLLIAELLNFIGEQELRGVTGSVKLDREIVYGISLPRKIAQACAEQDYSLAVQAAKDVMKQYTRDPHQYGGAQTGAMIEAWHGRALTALGSKYFDEAERLLISAVNQLKAERLRVPSISDAAGFRACGGLGFATEKLGAYYRTRGQHKTAAKCYARAIRLGREVQVWINLSGALNTQGLVQAQLGNLSNARALIEEGKDLRRELALPSLIASSLNTLGIIERRRGNYTEAIILHRRARARFTVLANRGGLRATLVNLAEALRRAGSQINSEIEQRIVLVTEAYTCAKTALGYGTEKEENIVRVRELLEAGCAARDLVRLHRTNPRNLEDIDQLTIDSRDYLERAARIARELNISRHIDALTNLAFLWWYANQPIRAEEALETARAAVPTEYVIDQTTGRSSISPDDASNDIWMHLAKQETLHGHLSAEKLKLQQQASEARNYEQILDQVAYHYVLTMQYNELHSSDEIGSIQAVEQIFKWLEKLDIEELDRFADSVSRAEHRLHLTQASGCYLKQSMISRGLWKDE